MSAPLCFARSALCLAGLALALACTTGSSSPSSTGADAANDPLASAPTTATATTATSGLSPNTTTIAATDPTATGAVLSNPNSAADSPNKVIIGTTPPGTATGAASGTAANANGTAANANAAHNANAPASSGNATAASGNATTATAPTGNANATNVPAWPNLGFVDYVGALGSKVVALTFDDGPDGAGTGQNNTNQVLDVLASYGIKATFFVCSDVWTTLSSDPSAQADLKRIIADGHDIGSHTDTHPHLDAISTSQIGSQFSKNLSVARSILGSSFSFDKIRAPFGYPFQTNNSNVSWVAPAAAPYGVHIGWGIDTDDWKCAQNGQDSSCILTNLKSQVSQGASGPILMHAVYQLTVQTLPQVIDYLRSEGYTFATAEQMVVSKYGMSSAALMAAHQAAQFTSSQVAAAAVRECAKNKVITLEY